MRRARNAWIVTFAALAGALVAPPAAQAITNVYALQASSTGPGGALVQYAVGPGGALAAAPPDTPLGAAPQDIAVTPNARFAYVMTSSPTATASIVPFVRGANGRLVPNGPETGALGAVSRGIVVNPQGTRLYYGHPSNVISWRAINADGTLGPPNTFAIGAGPVRTPWAQTLAMTPDGRNLYGAQFAAAGQPTVVWQSSIDPATGDGTPKSPAFVEFPAAPGGPEPSAVGRMAISPSGTHLYLAPDTSGVGIARWAIDPTSGALAGGTIAAPPSDGYAEAVVALSASGAALWAPSSGGGALLEAPRIRQFSVGAGAALSPLATPAPYAVAGPARDAVATPDGASLYLGQDGMVSEWAVSPGGALSPRAAGTPVGGLVNAGIAIAPSQAPVASFRVSMAGRTAVFDARASFDPDGEIARYDWDFGDGTGASDGGPITRHAYTTAGRHTVALTVTDADATSTEKLWTGTRMLRNGGSSARVTGTATVSVRFLPRPRKGKSVTVAVVSGRIFFRLPNSSRWVALDQLREVPLGSTVDARKGKARVTAEVNAKTRRTQKSMFYDWYFKVRQTKGARPFTEARLVNGSFAACRPSRRGRSGVFRRAGKKSRKSVRRLWGRGKGNFRTRGKHSSATVRGTTWLVEDRCDGTLTRVKRGRVDVRVGRTKRVVKLSSRKGRRSSYLAKAP